MGEQWQGPKNNRMIFHSIKRCKMLRPKKRDLVLHGPWYTFCGGKIILKLKFHTFAWHMLFWKSTWQSSTIPQTCFAGVHICILQSFWITFQSTLRNCACWNSGCLPSASLAFGTEVSIFYAGRAPETYGDVQGTWKAVVTHWSCRWQQLWAFSACLRCGRMKIPTPFLTQCFAGGFWGNQTRTHTLQRSCCFLLCWSFIADKKQKVSLMSPANLVSRN